MSNLFGWEATIAIANRFQDGADVLNAIEGFDEVTLQDDHVLMLNVINDDAGHRHIEWAEVGMDGTFPVSDAPPDWVVQEATTWGADYITRVDFVY